MIKHQLMKWLPLKSRSLWLISVFETVLTIHDLNIETAVFKFSSREFARLITFYAKLWVGSFWWISTKPRHKGTRASACWLDICWATHCLRHSSLMLNGSWFVWIKTFHVLVTMHLAVLHKSQVHVCLNLKALKYRFCNQNGSLMAIPLLAIVLSNFRK